MMGLCLGDKGNVGEYWGYEMSISLNKIKGLAVFSID